MNVSILITCLNERQNLKLLLPSIERLNKGNNNLEVIIRDDGSSDGTAEWVERHFKWVKLIKGDRNLGFARSNNAAFMYAKGDIIVFVNADTFLDPDFLVQGLAIFEKFPKAVGVNPNMIMPWVMDFDVYLKTDRAEMPAWEYQLTPFGYCQYVSVGKTIRKTNFMTGGGCFLKREALNTGEDVFDKNLGKVTYCEDSDLSMRLIERGGEIIYAPQAILYHNQTIKKLFGPSELVKLLKITWNRFYILAKRNSTDRFIHNYPLYIVGIIKKMEYIGLSGSKKLIATLAGGVLAVPFLALFPYWLWISSKNGDSPAPKK
ncbi:MAG: glycosyltransferase [Desulfobacteraceae bacterium]|jgi:GT2 family glycosyltransferase|nr:glycosyltransferase [Desulfobacteraceae bacterium]